MFGKPQAEHEWLKQLVGKWKSVAKCTMGPDQPWNDVEGTFEGRMMGDLWLLMDGEGGTPESGCWTSLITLGYDPQKQLYIGSFVSSSMTHLWPYSGTLDSTGKKLPLDSTGPKFTGEGTTSYRDTIEIVSPDLWHFSGEVLDDNGTWQTLMTSTNTRIA